MKGKGQTSVSQSWFKCSAIPSNGQDGGTLSRECKDGKTREFPFAPESIVLRETELPVEAEGSDSLICEPTEKPSKPKITMPQLSTADWAMIAALTAGLIFAFFGMLRYMWTQWFEETGYYQHGIFAPILAGYMIYRRKEDLKKIPIKPSAMGLVLVVVALVFAWRSHQVSSQFLGEVGFMLFLFGGSMYIFGSKMTRAAFMPLILLGFMLPLPEMIFTQLTNSGQVYSTKVAVKMLDVLGYHPMLQDNSVVTMDNYTLAIGVPCSGFKLTMALLMFAIFFSSIARFNWWRIGVMFLVLIPVAIIVNSWRIAMIGICGETFGETAGRLFHDYGSYLELVLAYGALFVLARWLGWKE